MTTAPTTKTRQDEDLTSLEGIRLAFLARFQAGSIGYHALGDAVLERYFEAEEQYPRPASAMTFRNFLQGRTTPRDPTGLLLYFAALGADEAEMRRIRAAMQQEVDRRLAAPAQDTALRAFRETELDSMPYSRALAECEAATRFEQSLSTPIASVSPTQYLLGTHGTPDQERDPGGWGLLQHMRGLQRFLEQIEFRLQDEFAELPASARRSRRWHAAAGVREVGTAFVDYLVHRPELAELLLSHRRFLLHGPMPERERLAAVESIQRLVMSLYHPFHRFAAEVVLDGDKRQACRSPTGEVALEVVGNRLLGVGLTFYVLTVLGSSGTGGFFAASQRARREFAHEGIAGAPIWSDEHEGLIGDHEQVLRRAGEMLEANPRVRYGEVRALFEEQARASATRCMRVWEQDYAPTFVRDAGVGIATEFHHRGLLSNSALTTFMKRFLTGADGQRLQAAHYDERRYELPART